MIEKYQDQLSIKYVKFQGRLGDKNLCAQWNRCIDLVADEEWLWVLPDDDLPSVKSVEFFYRVLEEEDDSSIHVIKFPVKVIDADGVEIRPVGDSPKTEKNYSFYYRIVSGQEMSTLGDNIFKRKIFEDRGRFVEFNKGWGSDHATVIRVASGGEIRHLSKEVSLGFRMSGANVSSIKEDGLEKIRCRLDFCHWLKSNERLFDGKPESNFYQLFFRKVEFYLVHEWPFNLRLWLEAYRLSIMCRGSYTLVPILKLALMKIRVRYFKKI